MTKQIKGEKYIYLLMGYTLAKQQNGKVSIGSDNGMVGDQHFLRTFRVIEHDGKEIITESKNSRHFAEFSRSFEIEDKGGSRPIIREYVDEYGDNHATRWIH